MAGKRRHRWTSDDGGQRCARCGVFRYMFFPIGEPRAQWIYEQASANAADAYEVRDDSERVPPCPGEVPHGG